MTSIEKDLADIRRLTRISLPESDRYVYRLGVAVYGFAWASSFMAEVICYPEVDDEICHGCCSLDSI